MKPTPRRGGYFKARSALWLKAHTDARWTSEDPAPKWWAELDAAWCVDAGILPSIRDYANFLGWKKGAVEGLLRDVFGDIERWAADKTRTKSGQQEDNERTESGQPAKVESRQEPDKQDSQRTAGGQSPDTSRARSSKQPQPQTSSSDFRTDMSPPPAAPLFAQPAAPEVSPSAAPAPKPQPKGDTLTPGEMAVWQAYRLHHPTTKATPPKAHQGLLRAAVTEHGAEAVVAVIRWAHQSEGGNARFLRGENPGGTVYLGLDNLLRKEKLPGRIELATKEAAGDVPIPKLSALPPGMKPRGVVIDAESGRVEEPARPATGSKRLDLMASLAERLRQQQELEEQEERQQQEEAQDA